MSLTDREIKELIASISEMARRVGAVFIPDEKKIAAIRAPMTEDDLQGCEHCSKEFPIQTMTMMGEYWFCQGCYEAWKAEFDRCDHHWTPEDSEFGEPGRYCDKCSGFQLLDDVGDVRGCDK